VLFVEGKVVIGMKFAPSQRQYFEGLLLLSAGLIPLLVGWKRNQMYVSEWCSVADCRICFTRPDRSSAGILQEYLDQRKSSNGVVEEANLHQPEEPDAADRSPPGALST
jgi:hypothetical protein